MAFSFVEHIADGIGKDFAVPFPYISQAHVKVAVNGVDVAFTWNSPGSVELVSLPAKDALVKVYRETPKDDRLVNFEDDSVIDEALLDAMALQLFYIAQEAFDLSATSITIVADGNYDARARRVKGVADPVEPTDAVNLRTFQSDFLPRLQAEANRAANAANTSLALKSDFDAKWQGLLQKESDFNNSYNQVRLWEQAVATNADAVLSARNAVQAMRTLVEGYKTSVEATRQAVNTETAAALATYNQAVAVAEARLEALVAAAEAAKVAAQASAQAAQAAATSAQGSATTATAKAQEANAAANRAVEAKNAVDAVAVDAVALQNAVQAAEAAAARAEAAEGAQVTWDMVTEKPAQFPPSAHTHPWSQVTDKPTVYPPAEHTHDWTTIGNKPTTFTPSAHTHSWASITDKPVLFSGSYADLTGVPTAFPPTTHTHTWAEVTGKPTVFPSDWSQVANKPSTYPPSTHNHDGVYVKQSRITISTSDPSGGVDGDLWFKYSV